MTSAYDNWLAAPYTDGDDRALAEERESERIAGDSDKVRELVTDNLDAIDSPLMSESWTADLLIALRESRPILNALCRGYTLEQAMSKCSGADHFRALLVAADAADRWIAEQIRGAAAEAVDDAQREVWGEE